MFYKMSRFISLFTFRLIFKNSIKIILSLVYAIAMQNQITLKYRNATSTKTTMSIIDWSDTYFRYIKNAL